MEKIIYVVQSSINLSTPDSETCFNIVGVADNKEDAKRMLKEEVNVFFNEYNERFVSLDDEDFWGAERNLSIDNEEDFPNDEYYCMDDTELEVFCKVSILEKVLNK